MESSHADRFGFMCPSFKIYAAETSAGNFICAAQNIEKVHLKNSKAIGDKNIIVSCIIMFSGNVWFYGRESKKAFITYSCFKLPELVQSQNCTFSARHCVHCVVHG